MNQLVKEYGKGFGYEQLRKMARFANEFSNEEIGLQPATKIPCRTLVKIFYKSNIKYEELFSQPGGKIHKPFSKSI